MTLGKDSSGHMNPAEKTSGREEKNTVVDATSLEERREPTKRPKEMDAAKKATPKASTSDISANLVTSYRSKIKPK